MAVRFDKKQEVLVVEPDNARDREALATLFSQERIELAAKLVSSRPVDSTLPEHESFADRTGEPLCRQGLNGRAIVDGFELLHENFIEKAQGVEWSGTHDGGSGTKSDKIPLVLDDVRGNHPLVLA